MDFDSISVHREQILPSIATEVENEMFHDTSIICKGGDCVKSSSLFLSGLSAWLAVLLKSINSEEFLIHLPEVEASTMKDIISMARRNLFQKAPILKTEEKLSSLNGVLWSRVEVEEDCYESDNMSLGSETYLEVKHELDIQENHSEDEDNPETSKDNHSLFNNGKIVTNHCKKTEEMSDNEEISLSGRRRRRQKSRPNYVVDEEEDSAEEGGEVLSKYQSLALESLKKQKQRNQEQDKEFKLDAKQSLILDGRDLTDPVSAFLGKDLGHKEICPICDKEFILGKRLMNRFKRHLRDHKIHVYECDCGVPLQTYEDRSEHIKLIHWKFQRCEFCDKILEECDVKIHYKRHKHMNKDVRDILDLRLDERYLRKKMDKLLCQHCGQSFVTKKEREEYTKHMEKHMVDKFSCKCNIDYAKMAFGERLQHIKVVHENSGYIACPDCPMYTKSMETLEKHKSDVHNFSHTCDVCGYVTKNKYCLKDHYDRLHSTRDQECDICKMKMTKLQLRDHLRKRHIEEVCQQCGVTVKNLKKHIKTMHVPDEEKPYPCPQCSRGFVSKKCLEAHIMNVHTKTRPYKCRYGCEFAYNDSSNRNQHEKKKHGGLYKN